MTCPTVAFTVFEVYSYLLRCLFVNSKLLANLVYLYIMNTIIIILARDSTFCWAAYVGKTIIYGLKGVHSASVYDCM